MLNPDHPISNAKWHLAIGNLADRKLIDTCLDYPWSVQFSPDGKYLVLLNYDRHQQELRIFDLEHWKLYRTGIYHTGEIIGWRAE
ncbi:MAG TPA: hypothetical protein VHL11_17825 [Phototrophicaceae bacterium]|nr:hypothetical protein [Phototrophicaceae bacterium]